MARIAIDPNLVEGKLLLEAVDSIQRTRALLGRVNDIMDYTRNGGDFAPLAQALGCTTAEAAVIFSRMSTIEGTMDSVDFQNLSELDQG